MNQFDGCGSHPCPVALAVLRAARTLDARLEAVLSPLQLSMAKFGVLRCLVAEERAMPLSALASRQQCVRSNMTQLADRLEADGLLRRVDDPNDRRAVLAEPTALGRAACAEAEIALRVEEDRLLAALSPDERQAMTDLVRRYVAVQETVATE